MAGSRVFWTVTCKKHGTEEASGGNRWVRVSPPKSKEHRKTGGCPRCMIIRLAEEKAAREESVTQQAE